MIWHPLTIPFRKRSHAFTKRETAIVGWITSPFLSSIHALARAPPGMRAFKRNKRTMCVKIDTHVCTAPRHTERFQDEKRHPHE